MPAYKDKKTGKWYASFYCMNWKGVREKKMKRGFETKKAALEWEREFLRQSKADLDMRFDTFVELYVTDLKQRLRENTFLTKESIIYKKVLPYFKEKKLNAITAKDVIKWQNELLAYRDENGKPYSKTYLKTIHNQLSAIFNHAIRYYDLKSNPAAKAGHIGEKEAGEMDFWTKEEIKEYLGMLYGIKSTDRMFPISKSFLHHEMDRGSAAAGVKRIKIHGLRHSHISHLIDLGFSAVAIADRVGHESIDITYRYAHLFPSKQVDMANKLENERIDLIG